MGFLTIAQLASAIGTVGLTVLFGVQLRCSSGRSWRTATPFKRCSRAAPRTSAPTSWSPQGTATASSPRSSLVTHRQGCCGEHRVRVLYTHGELCELPAGLGGRSFKRAAPLQGRADLSGAWRVDRHRLGLPREPRTLDAGDGAAGGDHGYQSRYESLTGEPYESLWRVNPRLIPGSLYTPKTDARNE